MKINFGSDYEQGWDSYSETWESSVKSNTMHHLGDEWGSPDLTETVLVRFVLPFLPPDARILEIGCGGGKYSEKLQPLAKELTCGDVSQKMLDRTRARVKDAENVRYVHLNGIDLEPLQDDSMDLVFSFDCFVHIDMEDVYCYLLEIRRVLRAGGVGVLHLANLNSVGGWAKFVKEARLNRGPNKHFDRFRFLTWEIVDKMRESLGLELLTSWREPWRDLLLVFRKPPAADGAGTLH